MFNNLIGLKPTRGLLSTRGVIPACRTLDCVSIFAQTIADASIVLSVTRGFDQLDPYSRQASSSCPSSPWLFAESFRFGVPTVATRHFFGDDHNPLIFEKSINMIKNQLNGELVQFDLTPFLEVAGLLYKGPWVAERYAAVGHFITDHKDDVDPIVYSIIEKGKDYRAFEAFTAAYELQRLKKITEEIWEKFDVMIVPTAPRTYTLDQIRQSPIEYNSHLGYYTNFVNLLDLSAVAVPAGIRPDGLPFSITLIGHAFTDNALLLLGDRIHRLLSNYIAGSKGLLANTPKFFPNENRLTCSNSFFLGVVGAHLSGQPLNFQLTERKARLIRSCRTRNEYRLYALKDSIPNKPGLLRVTDGSGSAIELEIWSVPNSSVASLIEMIPSPLSIGSVLLEDGEIVKGFLVEASAVQNAEDITHFGGWKSYLNQQNKSS